MAKNVTSVNQSGGITADTVNAETVHQSAVQVGTDAQDEKGWLTSKKAGLLLGHGANHDYPSHNAVL